MDIAYVITPADVVAAVEHHATHSPAARRTRRITNLISCAIVVVTLTVYGWWTNPQQVAVFAFFGALVAVVSYPSSAAIDRLLLRRQLRRALADGTNAGLLGEHQLSISEDGIFCRNAHGDSRIAWTAVERIEETARYTFIYVSAVSAIAVPHESITSGDLAAFVSALRDRFLSVRQAAAS